MSYLRSAFVALILVLLAVPSAMAEQMKDIFADYKDWLDPALQDRFGALEIRRDTQTLQGDVAVLNLPPGYYAILGDDARWVMETLWQNLPNPGTLGLVLKTGTSPLDESWAVAISYSGDGHISDLEAETMDYQAILKSYQESDAAANAERVKAGLPKMTTVGLSGTPGYDKATRTLRYSVLLRQDGHQEDFLNANAWVLSRHGYVNLNVLGVESQAADVDAAFPELIGLVSFTPGNAYADFVPGVDTVAEGGLEALLGGGVAQVGLVVLVLAFLKKGAFLVVLPVMWVVKRLRGGPKTS